MMCISLVLAGLLGSGTSLRAADSQSMNGQWSVVELVEDGKVIPPAAIPEWLPSGGKVDIEDGAILFTSHVDKEKHARIFSIDAAREPKGITITDVDKSQVKGIFKFQGQKLVVCLADHDAKEPPSDFSAEPGSKRMLMVLQRSATVPVVPVTAQAPVPATPATPAPAHPAEVVLSDADVARMLVGTWIYDDHGGELVVQYRADGTYTTTRQVEKSKLYKQIFVETPMSTGTWRIDHGRLLLQVLASQHLNRVGTLMGVTIRSISPTDLVFADDFGRLGLGRKVQ
ncbi:TIGR03067 domain-containing protein [Planctomicrobium sp. SH664]|uniref:TIGR03067 domain-containing protein n=1 Tax=Planctomicrobium sp. SH664 TaxID=3448125 RepID=UPI003F5B3BBD